MRIITKSKTLTIIYFSWKNRMTLISPQIPRVAKKSILAERIFSGQLGSKTSIFEQR